MGAEEGTAGLRLAYRLSRTDEFNFVKYMPSPAEICLHRFRHSLLDAKFIGTPLLMETWTGQSLRRGITFIQDM